MIQWLCNKIYRAGYRYEDGAIAVVESRPDVCMDKALRFNLLPARGGCILEIRTHDPKNHEWDTVTHVIPEGADVAKAVGSIVAMELLKR